MNTLEDRLRIAIRETGEEIGPQSVPPLRLRETGRRGPSRTMARRRWRAWLAPVAAAASVAAVVAVSLAISATFHGQAPGSRPATAQGPQGAPLGRPAALHDVPPYFVELTDLVQIQARQAVVRSTISGHALATVTPPRPYNVFTWVSAAANDRTFVLAAQHWWKIARGNAGMRAEERDNTTPTVFFRLSFDPASRAVRLTQLAVPVKPQSAQLAGMAVSPDGTRLALDLRKSISVVTLAAGTVRQWTWPGSGWIGNWKPYGQIFSWTADGKTLEFQQWGGKLDDTAHVRLLDTTAPGHSLKLARNVLTFPNKPGVPTFGALNALLTPDGTRIVTATVVYTRRPPGPGEITEYSVRTGKPVLSEDRFAPLPGWQNVLWAGPRGKALVVLDPRGKRIQYGRAEILGVLAGNKFTPIPHGTFQGNQTAW
jgi:hypothetical protein